MWINHEKSYNAIAGEYELLFPDYATMQQEWRKLLRRCFRPTEAGVGTTQQLRILDLCCGMGQQSLCLAEDGHFVLGLDISIQMLTRAREIAKERCLDVLFQQADCRYLSSALIGKGSFDGFVFGGSAILHFSAQELHHLLSELAAALNSKAQGIVDVFDWSQIPETFTWTPRAYQLGDDKEMLALEFYDRHKGHVYTSLVRLSRGRSGTWNLKADDFCYWCHTPQEIVTTFQSVGFTARIIREASTENPTAILFVHNGDCKDFCIV